MRRWGERQRLFQKGTGGPFYCSVYLTDGRRHVRSLGTEDHADALWVRLELALVLAEATGRRIGAIRQLRWEDIDYAAPAITWRADGDKMGVLWTIDVAESLVAELRGFQARLGGVGGWVFPAARCPDQPVDRWAMVKYLLQAERDAGLPKLGVSLA